MLSHTGTEAINTDRLLLRKFKLNDAYDMYKNWASDSAVTKYLSWKHHSNVALTKEIINQWINEYNTQMVYNWAIELKEVKQVIGGISIVALNDKNYSCEIGYCISKMHWSNGITTEALKAVIDYLFSKVNFNRIVAKHDTNNIDSGKVMLKSGMKYEGTLRQAKLRDNKEFYDLAIYAILKDDWLIENKSSSLNFRL